MAWVSLLVKVLIFLTRSMLQLEKFCHFLASYLVVTPVAFSPSMEVVSAISIPASDVNKNSKCHSDVLAKVPCVLHARNSSVYRSGSIMG